MITCKDDFYVSKSAAQPFLVSSRNAPDDTKNGCVADYMSAAFMILSDTLPFIKCFSIEKKKWWHLDSANKFKNMT